MEPNRIEIVDGVSIPEEEISFKASRSSGPGGQNVNKVESRVTLLFDVMRSESLSEGQKQRLLARLKTRINREGTLRITSQRARSQGGNRRLARERFVRLLQKALTEAPSRKKTRIPEGARRRRLEEKRMHADIKKRRSKPIRTEE